MALGNSILVAPTAQDRQKISGIISGTPKPGTCMTIKNTARSGTRWTWEAFNAGGRDGGFQIIAVLLEDEESGVNATTAFVSGTRGELYCPLPGDILNVLVADLSGTSSASELYTIGELFCPQDATGKLIPQNLATNPVRKPWASLESTALVNAYTADTLTAMMMTGF